VAGAEIGVFAAAAKAYRRAHGVSQTEVVAQLEGVGSHAWLSLRENNRRPMTPSEFGSVVRAVDGAVAVRAEGRAG